MGTEAITRRWLINWAAKGAVLSPILALLNTAEAKANSGDEEIKRNLSYYRDSALKNVVFYPDGKAVIFPSQAYGGDFYGRDAFYAALGLGDDRLSEELSPEFTLQTILLRILMTRRLFFT